MPSFLPQNIPTKIQTPPLLSTYIRYSYYYSLRELWTSNRTLTAEGELLTTENWAELPEGASLVYPGRPRCEELQYGRGCVGRGWVGLGRVWLGELITTEDGEELPEGASLVYSGRILCVELQ